MSDNEVIDFQQLKPRQNSHHQTFLQGICLSGRWNDMRVIFSFPMKHNSSPFVYVDSDESNMFAN